MYVCVCVCVCVCTQMEHGVGKRKIVPDLTVEFVNHFNGESLLQILQK